MERRQSLPRANAAAGSSPLSDHNASPLRRKSISFAPFNNIHDVEDSTNSPTRRSSLLRPPNTPSSPSLTNRKSAADTPRRLSKQHSSDDIQARVLWPASKKLIPAADAEADLSSERRDDAPITYNVSTFSSRQRISSYSEQSAAISKGDRGSRSLRYQIGKLHVERSLKKPSTPPSPSAFIGHPPASSALMHSGRFSFSEARKRSDFGVDFSSTESEQSENGAKFSRVKKPETPAWRPGSPLKGKNAGVGSFITQGLNNLFRRKSFQGSGSESVKKPVATAGAGSPGRERATTVKGGGSPGKEAMVAARVYGATAAVVEGEMQYKLRILHNYLTQWRFVNAGTLVVNKIKCDNAESTLVNAWVGLSDFRDSVAQKRVHLEKEKLKVKLNTVVCYQTKALETWGTMERQYSAALSSTKDSLQAVVCRLPITEHAKVDPQLLSILLRQATNVATAINGNIAKCHSRAQSTAPLAAELFQVVAKEKLLLQECIELMGLVSTLQVHEESLRSNIMQLKSKQFTRCIAQRSSS